MILNNHQYLPMFMDHDSPTRIFTADDLTQIFMAAARDIEAEAQAHDNARIACGGRAKRSAELLDESLDIACYLSDEVSMNVMNRLYDDKSKPSYYVVDVAYESANVVKAFQDEAAAPTGDFHERIIDRKRLTPRQVCENALIRREEAIYKAMCLRLAEAMPK